MSGDRPLRGSCSCGRNSYTVSLPQNAADVANVFFDSGGESRRTLASPLTAWLHVPLSCFQSSTTSFFPDETHSMIRKMFSSTREPNAKRVFCGYCGTHLTHWREKPEAEANFLNITVGSLFGDDIRTLEQLGLLPISREELPVREEFRPSFEESDQTTQAQAINTSRNVTGQRSPDDLEWMEEILTGTWLGKFPKICGGAEVNAGGVAHVEWEITEIGSKASESETVAGRGKRKLEEVGSGEDAQMQL